MRRALGGEASADVPCGDCTACCTSSQFVHIGPDEFDALAVIPTDLLFPEPGLPPGHLLMGYDRRGHCPMLVDGQCSVYENRPRTCRTYDCRIFAATGIEIDEPGKARIAERVRCWRFDVSDESDGLLSAALARGGGVRAETRTDAPGRAVTATGRAVLAVEIHDLFLRRRDAQLARRGRGRPDAVRAEVMRRSGRRG